MNKPLGCYTSYAPGDETYLLELQKRYGACLDKLTKREQLFLLYTISGHLCCIEPADFRDELVTETIDIQRRLNHHDLEGLCEALINQIRWGNHA